MLEKLQIAQYYFAKRWTLRGLRNGEDVQRRQRKLLLPLLRHARHQFPFYAQCDPENFAHWPIIDKAVMQEHFGAMNGYGISREAAWAAAEEGLAHGNSSGQLGELTIGTSTGTSGQRGLFLVSAGERAIWLGSILARCLPDFPLARHRVAVMLATGNTLYETASASGRLQFKFFDLKRGLDCHFDALGKFSPDVLVAPPKAVRALAEAGISLHLSHVFTGGEVLDPGDAAIIKNWSGIAPRPIYQATEGFLGVACQHGHIHLNEDDVLFEREAVPNHPDHFVPIITDLRRRAQAMIRYRLNDILVVAPGPCPCGSPLLALTRIEGRCDDVLRFASADGGDRVAIMPDALRAVILDSDRRISDFHLVQTSTTHVVLELGLGTPQQALQHAKSALQKFFNDLKIAKPITIDLALGMTIDHARKLRRIERRMD